MASGGGTTCQYVAYVVAVIKGRAATFQEKVTESKDYIVLINHIKDRIQD